MVIKRVVLVCFHGSQSDGIVLLYHLLIHIIYFPTKKREREYEENVRRLFLNKVGIFCFFTCVCAQLKIQTLALGEQRSAYTTKCYTYLQK